MDDEGIVRVEIEAKFLNLEYFEQILILVDFSIEVLGLPVVISCKDFKGLHDEAKSISYVARVMVF